jgi:uncharacterized protein YbjQ (UPF0145 family)
MLISTMNDIPGREITEVIGEVFGLTVRSRNIGAQIGAGLKSIIGGELKGMTKQLASSRQDAIARLDLLDLDRRAVGADLACHGVPAEVGDVEAHGENAVRAHSLGRLFQPSDRILTA